MKTYSRCRLNVEDDLIRVLSRIEPRISLLSNNRLSLRIDSSARCIIKCCLSFLFLLYACATVVALEKLYRPVFLKLFCTLTPNESTQFSLDPVA